MRIYQENSRDLRFLSVLARRLSQSMSPLTRFHYKSLLKQQKIKFVSRFTIAICLIRTLLIICLEAQMGQNRAQNQVFLSFFQVWFFGFLEILQGDSSEHCLLTSRGKTHEKNLMGTKLGPKVGVFPFSEGCIVSFPWYWTRLQLGTMSNIQQS